MSKTGKKYFPGKIKMEKYLKRTAAIIKLQTQQL
jgi:hypothetical protein